MAAESDPDARERLLRALAGGASQSEAARVSGYSRMHVSRLLKDPAFVAALDGARATAAEAPLDEDVKLALDVLRTIAQAGEEEVARVSAAKAILAHHAAKLAKKPKAATAPLPKLLTLEGGDAAADAWLKSNGA